MWMVEVPAPEMLRAHLDQAGGEVDDLGLARGVLDHGLALAPAPPPSCATWVAPTVTLGKVTRAPRRPFGARAIT